MADFHIEWVDGKREAKLNPDPLYPTGMDLDLSHGGTPSCRTELPYPARRCGHYVVVCRTCGKSAGVTTAGRADDPRSLTVRCRPPAR